LPRTPPGAIRRQGTAPAAYLVCSPRPSMPGFNAGYLGSEHTSKEMQMPVILWLLGVPLVVIVVLMLLGVL